MRCGLRHGNINEIGEKASVKPRKSPPAPPLSIKTRQPFLQTLKIAIPRECLPKKQIYRGTLKGEARFASEERARTVSERVCRFACMARRFIAVRCEGRSLRW